jgi:hypothetical protein
MGGLYCLPEAGGRIRSQGNYCLSPAGVLHSQNKVLKCAAYGDASMNGRRNGIRWLSRFKLIRRRRISLATLRMDGRRNGGFIADSWRIHICIKTMSVKGVYVIMKLMKQKK